MAKEEYSKQEKSKSLINFARDDAQTICELKRISRRTDGDGQQKANATVEKILGNIKENGDIALIKYTEVFDGFKPIPMAINGKDLKNAWDQTPKALQESLRLAHDRIKSFHQKQIPLDIQVQGCEGENISRKWRPVKKAGIYIPGGRASYPSTVLMNAIPAQVAGVEEIVMVSPASTNGKINKTVLAAAYLAGIKRVFRVCPCRTTICSIFCIISVRTSSLRPKISWIAPI